MRIIGGKNRGRKLDTLPDPRLRPTSDRVRESLFNILLHNDFVIEGTVVLDLCCGTGALGLEALSRGAEKAVFIDNNSDHLALCQKNITHLHETERCRLIRADITRLPPAPAVFDLVFLDPPYHKNLAGTALKNLSQGGWVNCDSLCIVETEKEIFEVTGFDLIDRRLYKTACLHFLQWRDDA